MSSTRLQFGSELQLIINIKVTQTKFIYKLSKSKVEKDCLSIFNWLYASVMLFDCMPT